MNKSAIWCVGICVLVFMWFQGEASGEFYRYVDKNGTVRFTDNLGSVPSDQRQGVEEYEEVETPPDPKPSSQEDDLKDIDDEQDEDLISEEAPGGEDMGEQTADQEGSQGEVPKDPVAERLEVQGEQLKAEYDRLMEQKFRLEGAASRRLTPSARRELEKDIQDFNALIRNYDKRREAHRKAVEDYQVSSQQVEE